MHSFLAFAVFVTLSPAVCALTVVPRPDRAARFLQAEGQRLGSAELLQLGEEAKQPDQLAKVKQMITHMIAKHEAAQAEDTDHKGFCDKEMAASTKKVKKMQDEIQKRTADNDLHSAQLAQLKDSISDLHEEIANGHKDRKKAADLRRKEAEAYEKFQSESDTTLQTLRRKRAGLDSALRKQREALEKEEEELTLKKVKAENKEQDRQFKFKKLDGEFAVAIARKTKEVEIKERQIVSKSHDLSLADGDFKAAQDEMAAAKEYAEKIKNTCVVRADPAKERKRSREEQISSLKEAYGILSGEDIPSYR